VKKTKKQTLLAKVTSATEEVGDAATALDKLLKDLKTAPRAEKTTISNIVEEAFTRLKAARVALSDAQKIIAKEAEE
jgi:hypothetical protein